MRKARSAVRDSASPLPAAAIALLTKEDIDLTLHHLRELEAQGMVRSRTDRAGVMRWERTWLDDGSTIEGSLGAQVLDNGVFRLTPDERDALGI
jgi:hypothetical protein